MASIYDAAEYILELNNKPSCANLNASVELDTQEEEPEVWPDVTPMKLQKLLYYVKGFSLVLLGRAMFPESFHAWRHGPVCPELYRRLKQYGRATLSPGDCGGDCSLLTAEEKELIEEVYDVYGSYSAARLRNQTHNQAPWQNAIDQIDTEITDQALRDFFPELVNV
jgi:uncharacterized phage-associated protein